MEKKIKMASSRSRGLVQVTDLWDIETYIDRGRSTEEEGDRLKSTIEEDISLDKTGGHSFASVFEIALSREIEIFEFAQDVGTDPGF